MPAHTATPWRADIVMVSDARKQLIAAVAPPGPHCAPRSIAEARANAEIIVRAVNAHAPAVAALRAARDVLAELPEAARNAARQAALRSISRALRLAEPQP